MGLGLTPHPVIVSTGDSKDDISVLFVLGRLRMGFPEWGLELAGSLFREVIEKCRFGFLLRPETACNNSPA